jgi:hypothetical protein
MAAQQGMRTAAAGPGSPYFEVKVLGILPDGWILIGAIFD